MIVLNQQFEAAKEFYVSTVGDDTQSGDKLSPFATIERAILAVRDIKGKTEGPINVYVRGGTYYLDNSLVFNPEDSGTEEGIITYQAYPGETPTISGGQVMKGRWEAYRDGIMMCSLDNYSHEGSAFTQLFVNGKRQTRARFPSTGYLHPDSTALEWPHQYMNYDPKTFSSQPWAKPHEAVMHIFPTAEWGNLQWAIKDIDEQTNTIHLGRGGFQINELMQGENASGISAASRYYIENVFEELDSPSEWYLNHEEGKLYWIPQAGVDVQSALVEAPRLKQVIVFKGTQDRPVHHITISGFRIAHTTSTFLELYEAPSLGDWALHRGGAVYMEGAEDCVLEHCFMDAVGGNAVFLNEYNRRNRIYGNRITGAGDSGVCLVGSKLHTLGSQYAYPFDNVVSNNLIHNIGVFGKQTAGVFISVSKNNSISHNHIHHVPRAAICINDGTWGGHIIEFNDIHDTVLETGDHGPFNSWGRDRFWCLNQSHGPASHGAGEVKLDAQKPVIIRNNRFVDDKGWGIDLDDGSSNYHVYNNLCIGVSIKLREGDYRLVENNIFVNAANPPGIHIGYEHNSDRFVRNIIVMNSAMDRPEVDIDFKNEQSAGAIYKFIGPPVDGKWLQELDYNVFYNDIGEFKAIIHYRPLRTKTEQFNLEQWKQLGWDTHSVYANPLFRAAEQGDYTVLPESPALKLGFKNFPMDRFGLLLDFRGK
jgi:predicted ester cyclase